MPDELYLRQEELRRAEDRRDLALIYPVDEYEYYYDHRAELVDTYNGKVIVVKDQTVIGVYDSEFEALRETTHKQGTFLVQRCVP
jgi:hypothetical protein